MDKRGYTNLIVLTAFFILFMIFVIYISPKNLTGHVTAQSQDEAGNLNIEENNLINVSLYGAGINKTGDVTQIFGEGFERYQKLICLTEFQGEPNVSILFYQPESHNPIAIFENINKNTVTDTKCAQTPNGNNICYALYNATIFNRGYWRCYSKIGNVFNQSNDFQMYSSQPRLLRNIPNIEINKEGNYTNQTQLILGDYFIDNDGQFLTYAVTGNKNILINIDDYGKVSFLNQREYEGYENILFRAYDGELGVFSNNITIKVGSGQTNNLQQCYSNWDCSIWGMCQNGQQTRTCTDRNTCGITIGKPIETRICIASADEVPQEIPQQKEVQGNIETKNFIIKDETTRIIILVIAIILIISMAGLGFYLWYKNKNPITNAQIQKTESIQEVKQAVTPQQTKVEEKQIMQDQTKVINLEELQKYIETMLNQSIKEEKIKLDLLKVGWAKTDIDKALGYVKVKLFIKSKVTQGFDKTKIKQSLLAKGWKQQDIEAIYKELKL